MLIGGRLGDGRWDDEGDEELGVFVGVSSVRLWWRGLGYVLFRLV